jgi:hypothetical protein
MGSCDGDKSSGRSIAENGDATEQDDQSHTVNPETEQQEAWATTEGYSPLTELDITSDYMMVSTGPTDDSDDDDDTSGHGAFFVNANSFHTAEEQDAAEPTATEIADSALLGMDEDYKRTLRSDIATPNDGNRNQVSADDFGTERALGDDSDMKLIADAFNATVEKTNRREYDPSTFTADWNIAPSSTMSSSAAVSVDTVAIRKAVQEISDNANDSPFQKRFAAWQEHQNSGKQTHQVVPQAPFIAFQRTTEKAKQATASLTRSATIAETLLRLQQQQLLDNTQNDIIIDVVGVDHVECETIERIQATFRPIVRWIGAWEAVEYNTVELRLIGRDLSSTVSSKPIDLLTPTASTKVVKAEATCYSEICYHDWHSQSQKVPALIIAFNAGIWGYNEWIPTIRYLSGGKSPVPMAITAYTLEEAQEDMDVIQETVSGSAARVLWIPEMNPFGSKVIRETKSSTREYRENSSWQAWLFGAEKV